MASEEFIERQIIIGLIVSAEYIQQIRTLIHPRLFEAPEAKRMAEWCLDYFDKYKRAPGRDIEGIFYQKLKEGLPEDLALEIEEDILPGLSDEYERETFNVQYLLNQTHQYFKERNLLIFQETIKTLVQSGELEQAEQFVYKYTPAVINEKTALDLSSRDALKRVDQAFLEASAPLIQFSGALGTLLNPQLIRGGFVAFMASEKRGKSYWLLELAARAIRQRCNVAFFQAGDMTESQQLRRICMYLAKKSDQERYAGEMYQPVKDCILNQIDDCDKRERECDFGVFKGRLKKDIRNEMTFDELKEAFDENPDYVPCRNCREYTQQRIGAVWLEKVDVGDVLTRRDARKHLHRFFANNKRRFMLSTHVNGSLSVSQIKASLALWEQQWGFVPDVIIVDYADLLTSQGTEFRHKQNQIWIDLRSLSQETNALVVTVTQADSDSYERNRLTLKNFSEDKRKYAHVTAMFALNQDPKGREKSLGLMRINEILVREGGGDTHSDVYVLQNLRRARPYLGNYL